MSNRLAHNHVLVLSSSELVPMKKLRSSDFELIQKPRSIPSHPLHSDIFPILLFGPELLNIIFSHLSLPTIARCLQVHRQWTKKLFYDLLTEVDLDDCLFPRTPDSNENFTCDLYVLSNWTVLSF